MVVAQQLDEHNIAQQVCHHFLQLGSSVLNI